MSQAPKPARRGPGGTRILDPCGTRVRPSLAIALEITRDQERLPRVLPRKSGSLEVSFEQTTSGTGRTAQCAARFWRSWAMYGSAGHKTGNLPRRFDIPITRDLRWEPDRWPHRQNSANSPFTMA